MKQRGFTMVELIVTMVLVGILAVAVVPRFDTLRGFDQVGYRDQVKATLEYARKSAVAQRRNVQVTLAAGTVTVNIDNDIPEGAAANTFGRNLNLPGTSSNQIVAPAGVTLGPATTLTFDPLGRPSAAGSYAITGVAQAITVEAETGYVH